MFDVPGLDVERKEQPGDATFLKTIDIRAIRIRRIPAEIEIIIRHRRGDVVVRVNDKRAPMNCQRPLP